MINFEKIIEHCVEREGLNELLDVKIRKEKVLFVPEIIDVKLFYKINRLILKSIVDGNKDKKCEVNIKIGAFNDFIVFIWEVCGGRKTGRYANAIVDLINNKIDGFGYIIRTKKGFSMYLC